MKQNRIKRSIYTRIFGIFLATYLLLMTGFSVFLVSQEKKTVDKELGLVHTRISNSVVENLRDYLDDDHQITDLSGVKKAFANKPIDIDISILDVPEIALFTSDYELIYHTNDYWRCSYNVYHEESDSYHGRYGLLNPKDWFSEEEVQELQNYLYANPKVKEVGDLSGYSLSIFGFWMEDEIIIPDKIYVTPIYVNTFDEHGNVASSGGTYREDLVYSSGYVNTKDLPYFEHGSILPRFNDPDNKDREEIRQMVMDQSKLKETIEKYLHNFESPISNERVNKLIYRYHMVVPYELSMRVMEDQSLYSEFWTAVGLDIDIGERVSSTLIYVWTSCLFIFMIASDILARQSLKIYLKREELERQRKEMTDALAHDLKTPLSIISGYAQNLQEDIHTEKRAHYAKHIHANVERMDQIIRKMFEMTKLESDSFNLNLIEVSLGEICKGIMNRYEQLCDEKSISTYLEGNADVKVDPSLIERVIDNFFINAMDHTTEDGIITIRILEDTLEVFNRGSHIPEDQMEEIWLPYEKGNTERSNTKGTGLGLSISQTILKLHGFPYGAKNSEDGVIFWFRFKN